MAIAGISVYMRLNAHFPFVIASDQFNPVSLNALIWQHATGRQVEISGFLSQKHQKSSQIIVHIQSIHYIE